MSTARFWTLLLALPLLAGCIRWADSTAYLTGKGVEQPTLDSFMVCHGYDCTFKTMVQLEPADWRQVADIFAQPPGDSAEERARIVAAVAMLEDKVGRRIGTTEDIGGVAFLAAGDPGQMDCIDESINTTIYVRLLEQQGLLRWHRASGPAFRGAFVDGRWYHQTAVIVDLATKQEYALDTWFNGNGEPAVLMQLADWRWSWDRSWGQKRS